MPDNWRYAECMALLLYKYCHEPGVKRARCEGCDPVKKRNGEGIIMKKEFLEGLDLGEGKKLSKTAINAIWTKTAKTTRRKKTPHKPWPRSAITGLKFTSESAKKAFVADLTAKKLPLQEGKTAGAFKTLPRNDMCVRI
jgi:hypothetical protein